MIGGNRERWNDRASHKPPKKNDPCKEPTCNKSFTRTRYNQEYCCSGCKRKYDARALSRSRCLYEPARAWYAGKSKAKKDDPVKILSTEALRFMGRELARWRDEDAEMRKIADRERMAA